MIAATIALRLFSLAFALVMLFCDAADFWISSRFSVEPQNLQTPTEESISSLQRGQRAKPRSPASPNPVSDIWPGLYACLFLRTATCV
jgi:hypothetical protein